MELVLNFQFPIPNSQLPTPKVQSPKSKVHSSASPGFRVAFSFRGRQGPSGGDELNVLHAGRNYGWPFVSFGRDYWGARLSTHPSVEGFEDPTVVWLPSIGLTGMTFYTGDRFPHWKNNVFVGGLREGGIPRTGQLQRIVFNDKWEELRREPMLMELGQRIRDVRQGPDGFLYVLTAEEDGALLRIEPR